MGNFPMVGLAELRDKYTSLGSELASVACLAGMLPPSPQRKCCSRSHLLHLWLSIVAVADSRWRVAVAPERI